MSAYDAPEWDDDDIEKMERELENDKMQANAVAVPDDVFDDAPAAAGSSSTSATTTTKKRLSDGGSGGVDDDRGSAYPGNVHSAATGDSGGQKKARKDVPLASFFSQGPSTSEPPAPAGSGRTAHSSRQAARRATPRTRMRP